MALTATADLIMSAAVNGAAVPAFNAITLEHAEGIAAGVERSGAAALIQVSENTIRFHGGRMAPLVSACARIAEGSDAALGVHLDHLQDAALIDEAIATAADLGVTSKPLKNIGLEHIKLRRPPKRNSPPTPPR